MWHVTGENPPRRPAPRSALPALMLAALVWVPAHDADRVGTARVTPSAGVVIEAPPAAGAPEVSFRALPPVGAVSSLDESGSLDELDDDDTRLVAPLAFTPLVSAPSPFVANPSRPVTERTNPLFLTLVRFRC